MDISDRFTMSRKSSTCHLAGNAVLRVLACAAALAAAVIAVLNKQNRWGIEANYKLFDGFKFFVIGNFICAAYSALTALLICKLSGTYVLHLFDLAMVNLQMATVAVATAIGYIAMKGNPLTGWYEVCRLYEQYCRKSTISVAASFLAVVLLFVICAVSRLGRNTR